MGLMWDFPLRQGGENGKPSPGTTHLQRPMNILYLVLALATVSTVMSIINVVIAVKAYKANKDKDVQD